MSKKDASLIERISPLATRSTHERFVAVGDKLVRAKARSAAENARLREIHIFHQGDPDTLQRMLNAVQPGSYLRPHRHLDPPKSEAFVILQGAAGFIAFEDDGSVLEENFALIDPARGYYMVDCRPGVWHAFFALAPDTVVFEVKQGPYSALSDKDFAPWAPPPESEQASAYLAELEDRFRKHWDLPPRSWKP